MTYIPLGYADLAIAALLVLINAGLSLALRLGLEGRLVLAAVRMVAQLLLVGLILQGLFAVASPWLTLLAALVMVAFAAHEIRARQARPLTGAWTHGLGGGAMLLAGTAATLLALTTQIQPDPWHDPRFALPLLGMILGNAMTGVSIGLDRLLTGVVRERAAIEARLALGHTRAQALSGPLREAFRAGLIPVINSMSAAGIVFLPGMMTGQILSGTPPVEAVKYQILVMFLIAGATGLGVLVALLGGARRLSDPRHRLRLDRLAPDKG
ncbi:MAG: iron export ABC transporter permease subunit FetB [Rhodobacterales bacterium]|nr:iron export ABC transporter permease subunit FetB [Rhodobacterales bacterium]